MKNIRQKLITVVLAMGVSAGILRAAEQWVPVPFVKQSGRDYGLTLGGEEGQWIQSMAVAPDNSYILIGIDVGGMFRSTDGGATWAPSNTGYAARGVGDFAIDPNNTNRVLAVGGNQAGNDNNGMHLSTDGGLTWDQRYRSYMKDYKEYRLEVDYDGSSYNAGLGYSTVAYWSSSASTTGGAKLYKSTDGGQTWQVKNASSTYGSKSVVVSPGNGNVFLWGDGKLYLSTDGGTSFSVKMSSGVRAVDIVHTQPSHVYVAKDDGIYRSTDNGQNFTKTGSSMPGATTRGLTVSPANPDRMLIWQEIANYNWPRYYSHNGGDSWQSSQEPNPTAVPKFFNWNMPRQGVFGWHPTDQNIAWSSGSDNARRSTDGGASFQWYSEGINNFCPVGLHNFNMHDPDLLFFSGYDKGGAFSSDGGYTWEIAQTAQLHWGGGHGASSYAVTATHLVGLGYLVRNETAYICYSTNGGDSFTRTNLIVNGIQVSAGDPKDPDNVFLGEWRSTNKGVSWTKMTGIDGVLAWNPSGGQELYGAQGATAKVSTNSGQSWQSIVTLPANIKDIAYDQVQNMLFIVTNNKIYSYDRDTSNLVDLTSNTPADQYGVRRIETVATDPVDPSIVYISHKGGGYLPENSVRRSQDSGQTWEIISRTTLTPNPQYGVSGATLSAFIRVHPTTRELWVGTGCFGIWKIARPGGTTIIPSEQGSGGSGGGGSGGGGSGTWTQIAYDDFESGWGNYTPDDDASIHVGAGESHEGTQSGMAFRDGTFELTTGFDATAHTQLRVSFWYYPRSMDDSSEGFALDFHDGSGWVQVEDWFLTTDFSNDTFYDVSIVLDDTAYTFPTNAKIRIRSIASGTYDFVHIDELLIEGDGSTGGGSGGGGSGGTWTQVAFDTFESGWGNYTAVDDASIHVGAAESHEGSQSGMAFRDGIFELTNSFDATGFSEVRVSFWYYPRSMDDNSEGFAVDFYDGSTWVQVEDWFLTTDFSNDTFYEETLLIDGSSYTLPANAKIRIRAIASGTFDFVHIDELLIEGDGSSGGGGSGGGSAAFQESGGQVSIEAENFETDSGNSGAGDSWVVVSESGASGSLLRAMPNNGTNNGLSLTGPRLDYDINFTTTGTYRVWVRMRADTTNDDSIHVGLDGVCVTNGSGLGLSSGASSSLVWVDDVNNGVQDVSIQIPTAGVYTLNIWNREDGAYIDKIVLNQSGTMPSGTGPAESPYN